MKLASGQARGLLKKREDERVEFRRAASASPANLWASYSAFCNTDGGVIILGVAQDATWSGNIYDSFFKIHDRVTGDVKIPFKIADDGITRIDDTPVHKALREVLANALIHADCHGRHGIVAEKHFRTITFPNPGTMRISKSVAVAGGTSDARNTAIFDIFALVDIGERSGMGLASLHGLWRKYGYAEPKITESCDPDRTVIAVTTDDDTVNGAANRSAIGLKPDQDPNRSTTKAVQESSGDGAGAVQKQSPEIDVARPPLNELPASARQVLGAIADDCFMTQRGLVSKIGLARSTVIKATAILIKNGCLRRVGPKKGGHWEVI